MSSFLNVRLHCYTQFCRILELCTSLCYSTPCSFATFYHPSVLFILQLNPQRFIVCSYSFQTITRLFVCESLTQKITIKHSFFLLIPHFSDISHFIYKSNTSIRFFVCLFIFHQSLNPIVCSSSINDYSSSSSSLVPLPSPQP